MSEIRSRRYKKISLLIGKIILVVGLITLTACASLIKAGTLNKVHENFNAQNYKETLTLIRRAENLNEISPNLMAELTYMKARSLEALGNSSEATALYSYLISEHLNTQYAWLAEIRLGKATDVSQPRL